VHGIGCRFELDSGEDIDIDWDIEGRAVFDAWRLRTYALSIGQSDVSQDELLEAAHRSRALIAVRSGWFTVDW
jgi:hypothetical protein